MEGADAKFRVLLVEDEPVIRELVRTMVDGPSTEVSCVGDGAEALRAVREIKPDLVLLDIVLPSLDGLTICRMLKSDPLTRDVPVFMLTAKIRPADHEAGKRAGADGYIEKPFRGSDLIDLVQALATRKRGRAGTA